ncbi:hypothetical protein GCM10027280_45350 [Micromonospora polyrhachis]|uniref:Uncharacterized protein n=1 Tax=Micromonospora polyrhachis TaxID=1282883 RepID=A0A7W7WP85_9ACTN|nr:hypothetical protein [Micromonospora polyrhachis]MBB4958951.1 hypothetical protein [Micromonospora polyrhachis]
MALLTASSVTQSASNVAPAAIGTSNTISAGDIGTRGCLLNVINGAAASVDVTLVDPGRTPAGNAGLVSAQAVANGTDRWFRLGPALVDPATGVATVTVSAAASVTYKLIRL